jgi:hypothetical protein
MAKVPHLEIKIQDQITEDQLRAAFPKPLTHREKFNLINSRSASTGETYLKYYIETKFYETNFKVSSDCNDITFICLGANAVTIQGIPLVQSQSLRFTGNRGEIDTTQYEIKFASAFAAGNFVAVLRKLYI